MGLTLVTGPANAAKAQVVLDAFNAALSRGPILVVPRAADVEHYRRELAVRGGSLGLSVESFGGLIREVARRGGIGGRVFGEHAREHILRAVIAATQLEQLGPASETPGFVRALAAFVAELESRRVEPARFTAALRAWAGEGTRRRRYTEELAGLYGGYRRALARLGGLDAELVAVRARASPPVSYTHLTLPTNREV